MTEQLYEDQYVNVGGINTRFWEAGDQGSVIILVHGVFSSIESWSLNMPSLAENHRVYALDMPGFGLTDKIPMSSLVQGAQFVNDFIKTQNIDKATLVGHSLGGGYSLHFAIQYPDKLDRLVLIDSLGLGTNFHYIFRLLSLPVIGEFISRPSRSGTRRSLNVAVYDKSLVTDELVETGYRFAALPGAQKSLLSMLRSGMKFGVMHPEFIRPIIEKLPSIKAPTLIIWGEQDLIFPVDHAQVALKGIPNAQLTVFECCGHIPYLEHPDKFNSLVKEFLAK
jgi:4,5:9,10-diseco-3-hydroxy-5,9,17-trioxoandrosta-1(10),2-diene-4-oate hydrolase